MDAVRQRREDDRWSTSDELLAQLIELVSIVRIEAWLIAGVPRHKLPDSYHVTRPGEQEAKPVVVTPSQFARLSVVA
jgi:hypothetical protein